MGNCGHDIDIDKGREVYPAKHVGRTAHNELEWRHRDDWQWLQIFPCHCGRHRCAAPRVCTAIPSQKSIVGLPRQAWRDRLSPHECSAACAKRLWSAGEDEMDELRQAIRQERLLHGRVDPNNGRKPTNSRIHNITHEVRGSCSPAPPLFPDFEPLPRSAGMSRENLRTCQNGAPFTGAKS
jgi:hypothetical protein